MSPEIGTTARNARNLEILHNACGGDDSHAFVYVVVGVELASADNDVAGIVACDVSTLSRFQLTDLASLVSDFDFLSVLVLQVELAVYGNALTC